MKKLLSIVLAMVMLLSLTAVAFADAVPIENGKEIFTNMSNFYTPLKLKIGYNKSHKINSSLKYDDHGYNYVLTSISDFSNTDAEGVQEIDFGKEIKICKDNKAAIISELEIELNSGSTIDPATIDPRIYTPYNFDIFPFQVTEDNFSVTYRVNRGKELIEAPFLDGAGNVVIKFRDKETIHSESKPDFILSQLAVRSRRSIKNYDVGVMRSGVSFYLDSEKFDQFFDTDGKQYDLSTSDSSFVTVGTKYQEVDVTDGDFYFGDYMGETVKVVSYDNSVYRANSYYDDYNIYISGRVFVDEKIKFDVNYDLTPKAKEVLAKNIDADIDIFNIVMEGVTAGQNIRLTVEEKNGVLPGQQKVYTVDKNGVLKPAAFKWNADEYGWEGKINKSTTYLVSDIALKGVTAGGANGNVPKDENNPETGGNTYLGLAVALAAMSAIGLGAMSIKRKHEN